MSGKEEKIIDIKGFYNVKTGDNVTVIMKQSMGFIALFLGYILPLLVVLIILIIFVILGYSELVSGLMAISSLLPYYFILYFLRNKINDKFVFSLKI